MHDKGLWFGTGVTFVAAAALLAVVNYDTSAKHADQGYPKAYDAARHEAIKASETVTGPGPVSKSYGTLPVFTSLQETEEYNRLKYTPWKTEAEHMALQKELTDFGIKHSKDNTAWDLKQPTYCITKLLPQGIYELKLDNGSLMYGLLKEASFEAAPPSPTCKGSAMTQPPPPKPQPGFGENFSADILCVPVAILLMLWHFVAGELAGTQARRARLWEKKGDGWIVDEFGFWRVKYIGAGGSRIVDARPRSQRILDETSARRTAAWWVPLVFVVWATATIIEAEAYKDDHGHDGGLVVIFWATQIFFLMLPLASDLLYFSGAQFFKGAMVLDPQMEHAMSNPPQQPQGTTEAETI